MKVSTSTDVYQESNNLAAEGFFHVVILRCIENQTNNGTTIDGTFVELQVLDGTVSDQAEKLHNETIFNPDLRKDQDKIDNANRKITAFLIACNAVTPEQLGKDIEVDVTSLRGQQMVVKIERRMDKDPATQKFTVPSKYVQVSYNHFYHIDDPRVATVPKDKEALAMPGVIRRDAKFFEPLLPKKPAPKSEVKKDEFASI